MGELRAVEQHFLRYQCSGDPAALAAVFDALAPRLLLLAAHLTRDRQAAEDLVQETFVAAMRSAKEFRAGAALMPWLSGILSRRARALLRARRRTLDVERLARPEAADPCTAAADAELVARLAQAIEELAPPYREALLLRLHHGLDSRAIGHVLGRAPDTVRSQLRRGLARLRHRLPPTLLAPAMALLTPPSGLAAMRTAVLRAAAKPAAAPAAAIGAVLAGGLVIKKLLWVAACAAAVLLWRPWEGEAPPAGASAVRVEMPVSQRVSATAQEQENRAEMRSVRDEGREDRTARVEVAPAPATTWRLSGRCVDAESRMPVMGAEVRVSVRPPEVVGSGSTQPDGAFVVELPERPGRYIVVDVDAAGYARWHLQRPLAIREMEVALGDVPLVPGVRAAGVLVDPEGRPLGGLPLHLWSSYGKDERMFARVTTDGAGGFATDETLPPGELGAAVQVQRYLVRSVHPTTLSRGGPPIRVVAEWIEDTITGTVVDRQGRPVAEQIVVAEAIRNGRAAERVGDGITDMNGSFTLWSEKDYRGDVAIRLSMGRVRDQVVEGSFRWGDRDVHIVVDLLLVTTMHVVDAVSGSPLPTAEFSVQQSSGSSFLSSSMPAPFRLHLPPGTYDVLVRPRDGQHVPAKIRVEVGEHDVEVDVPLIPGAPRVVRMLDENGHPCANEEVMLVQGEPKHPALAELDRVRTDENGEAELVLPTVPDHGVQLSFRGARLPLGVAPTNGAVPLVLTVPRR